MSSDISLTPRTRPPRGGAGSHHHTRAAPYGGAPGGAVRAADPVTSGAPGARQRHEPSWSEVWDFIEAHPHGGTLEEVAEAFGSTRERIRQVETKALRKLPASCLRAEIVARDASARDAEGYFTHPDGQGS